MQLIQNIRKGDALTDGKLAHFEEGIVTSLGAGLEIGGPPDYQNGMLQIKFNVF